MGRKTIETGEWLIPALLAGLLIAPPAGRAELTDAQAQAVLKAAAVDAGLCVHLGCGDGKGTAALAAGGRLLVHGLAADRATAEAARQHIRSRGMYGRVSVQAADLRRLPYADNLVNLVVADDLPALLKAGLTVKEIVRVLCPNGTALLGGAGQGALTGIDGAAGKVAGLDGWVKVVKPRPAGMDDWTHRGHDASNTMVSQDTALRPVSGLRWTVGPYWPFVGKRSTWAAVAAGGRLYYITWNDAPNLYKVKNEAPARTFLVARDAFNGVRLWTRPFPTGYRPVEPAELKGRTGRSRSSVIRRHFAGFAGLADRLVAAGDRVYTVLDGKLVALDGATGKVAENYEGGPEPRQVLLHQGNLIVAGRESIRVIDPATGERRWERPMTGHVVAGDGRIFFFTRQPKTRSLPQLVCLDLNTGGELWRSKQADLTYKLSYFFCRGGVLVLAYTYRQDGKTVKALSAETGELLWSRMSRRAGNRRTEVFHVDGLVWFRRQEKTDGAPGKPDTFMVGVDPLTGRRRRRVLIGRFAGVGCYRKMATAGYILGTRPLTFISWKDGTVHRFPGGRHTCALGLVPANGLIYGFTHECQCVKDAVRGFVAFERAEVFETPPVRLIRGPAYGSAAEDTGGDVGPREWPTFRHDPQRSAASKAEVPADVRLLWRRQLTEPVAESSLTKDWKTNPLGPDPLTAPTVAAGLAFVAEINSHRLVAVDAATGRIRWTAVAGGRLDTPPTVHRGLCLFGSADGWVYCLRAADGKEVWRYRAAPAERRIVAFGQLESKWPVVGGVLIDRGVAYCLAGRASALDGGIYSHAIDPLTGARLRVLRHPAGGTCDILVSAGSRIVMVNGDVSGRVSLTPVAKPAADRPRLEYLRGGVVGKSGTLSRAWRLGRVLDRSWQMPSAKEVPTWDVPVERPPLPQTLKWHNKWLRRHALVKSFRGCVGQLVAGLPDGERAFGYEGLPPKRWGGRLFARQGGKTVWTVNVPEPAQIESMILAGDVVFAAGTADRLAPGKGGFLWAISAADGSNLKEIRLQARPVPEGIAAAYGKLYVVTSDGQLLCFGGK